MTQSAPYCGRKSTRKISSLILAAIFFAAAVEPAFAYIDPGTGSILTSAMLGGFAALSYTLRSQFYRLKAYMAGRGQKEPGEGGETSR
jgi:hypothetical protein